jgi:predicted RNA-binding Zn ribbon-like protein
MEADVTIDPRTIRLVGGDVALDFVNTIDEGTDVLATAAGFAVWADRLGLPSPSRRVPLSEIHAARGVVGAVLRPLATGAAPRPADLRALRELERSALAGATLAPGGWRFTDPLAAIVHAATELIARGRLDRLKACANHDHPCDWLFLDDSRNGTRRWCSMEGCGTEVKIRRLTARRRAAGRGVS